MNQTKLEIPFLSPEEKVIGRAYLTADGEIVFAPHSGATEVVLVEAHAGAKGPWAVRRRPPQARPRTRAAGGV